MDEETAEADQWFDYSPVTTTAAAVVNGSVYTNSAGWFVVVPAAGTSYVPLNFLYSPGN